MPYRQTLKWGEALMLEAHYAGGLNPAVKRIHATAGAHHGTRNTYAALYEMEAAPTRQPWVDRAFLLLLALGQDPVEWGLDLSLVSPMVRTCSLGSPRYLAPQLAA